MRGRVMSLNAIAFLGSTPIGAPLVGYISDVSNPRVAFVVGGVATLLASIPLLVLATRQRRRRLQPSEEVPKVVRLAAADAALPPQLQKQTG
jgi:MFS family permease